MEGKTNIRETVARDGGASEARRQYAALCWRRMGEKIEVLLITSRDTGRWIIPKGWPIKGLGPCQTALQEAYEEAGVEGKASDDCVGLFPYVKVLDDASGLPCVVSVFPVRVRKLADSFPERSERRRKWFSPKKAAQKVDEPELQALLRSFTPPGAKGRGDKKAG